MQITVKIKSHFGREDIYPVDENAILFATIARSSTLSNSAIQAIKSLGYTVNVQSDNPETL